MDDFDDRLARLDLGLFAAIESQSTDKDKETFLACQLAVRELSPGYRYLEIGSHLGGSIQPHLLDPKCERIYSIDKRPPFQPDERGYDFYYDQNSTARMIELLKAVSDDTRKLETIDGETRSIDPDRIGESVQLCFIDGEHTDAAAYADFLFCLKVLDDDGAIVFHDAQITYNAISQAVEHLRKLERPFHAYSLPNAAFVIEIGEYPLHLNPRIAERLIDNHESYLYALKENDRFRRVATGFPHGTFERLRSKLGVARSKLFAAR